MSIHDLTVAQLARQLRAKEISAVEVAKHFMARGAAHESLGCYLATNEEVTLAQAKAADARISAGDSAPLLGVPLAHKVIFVTQYFPSSAGSKMLEG
jgi:aspartyl-tRNA(Asn)/glutamyl-tRNA(Gln) amidotransferase subunit A